MRRLRSVLVLVVLAVLLAPAPAGACQGQVRMASGYAASGLSGGAVFPGDLCGPGSDWVNHELAPGANVVVVRFHDSLVRADADEMRVSLSGNLVGAEVDLVLETSTPYPIYRSPEIAITPAVAGWIDIALWDGDHMHTTTYTTIL